MNKIVKVPDYLEGIESRIMFSMLGLSCLVGFFQHKTLKQYRLKKFSSELCIPTTSIPPLTFSYSYFFHTSILISSPLPSVNHLIDLVFIVIKYSKIHLVDT